MEKKAIGAVLGQAVFIVSAQLLLKIGIGTVAVVGSPGELLTKENGIFRRMTQLQIASAGWSI